MQVDEHGQRRGVARWNLEVRALQSILKAGDGNIGGLQPVLAPPSLAPLWVLRILEKAFFSAPVLQL